MMASTSDIRHALLTCATCLNEVTCLKEEVLHGKMHSGTWSQSRASYYVCAVRARRITLMYTTALLGMRTCCTLPVHLRSIQAKTLPRECVPNDAVSDLTLSLPSVGGARSKVSRLLFTKASPLHTIAHSSQATASVLVDLCAVSECSASLLFDLRAVGQVLGDGSGNNYLCKPSGLGAHSGGVVIVVFSRYCAHTLAAAAEELPLPEEASCIGRRFSRARSQNPVLFKTTSFCLLVTSY